jgi:hypothetical protein
MPTDFDRWLSEQFADTGTFTALLVLLDVAEPRVTPVCSSYVNVIGDEIDWDEMTVLLQGPVSPGTRSRSSSRSPTAAGRSRASRLTAGSRFSPRRSRWTGYT